jgi:hypothetical protein
MPDEEQKAMLEQNIQMALSKENISLEDAIDIREIANIKMANQLLKVKRKAKQDRESQQMQQQQQMQAEMQASAQQAAAQMAMQTQQAEVQSKMALKEAEVGFEIQKLQREAELKQQLMQVEFQMQMQLKGLESSALQSRETEREKAKDGRISQQSTQTSKMIEQKKRDLPAINFESNEDSLDGFDLAEFNPR